MNHDGIVFSRRLLLYKSLYFTGMGIRYVHFGFSRRFAPSPLSILKIVKFHETVMQLHGLVQAAACIHMLLLLAHSYCSRPPRPPAPAPRPPEVVEVRTAREDEQCGER